MERGATRGRLQRAIRRTIGEKEGAQQDSAPYGTRTAAEVFVLRLGVKTRKEREEKKEKKKRSNYLIPHVPGKMPREILTITVGQAGNQIGWRFWDTVVREHAAVRC